MSDSPSSGTFKIISWNVCGIRALIAQGYSLPGLFKDALGDPDVVCFQESRVPEDKVTSEMRHVPGYESFFAFCTTKRGYSGVTTYVRDGMNVQHAETAVFDGDDEDLNAEGRTLVVEVGDMAIINCYFPNAGMGEARLLVKSRYCAAIERKLASFRAAHRPAVLLGDLNIAHTPLDVYDESKAAGKACCTAMERQWLSHMVAIGYADALRLVRPGVPGLYTWWSLVTAGRAKNQGWRLDYFIIPPELRGNVRECDVLDKQMGSDHCPVSLVLDRRPKLGPRPKTPHPLSSRSQPKKVTLDKFFAPKKRVTPGPTATGTNVAPATGTNVAPATGTNVAPATGTNVAPAAGTSVDGKTLEGSTGNEVPVKRRAVDVDS